MSLTVSELDGIEEGERKKKIRKVEIRCELERWVRTGEKGPQMDDSRRVLSQLDIILEGLH